MTQYLAIDLLYLLLPAAVANMAPVIVRKWGIMSFLDTPLDAGLMINKKPFLGTHKTLRGLVSGIIAATCVTGVQALLAPTMFDVVDYHQVWLVLGILLGAGALIGDAAKSFFKRRVGVPEGSPWVPFDQIDFGIGSIIFILPIVWLGWPVSVAAVALLALGHVLTVRTGHILGWRKEKW
jgi:CDP-2,3-bis-(O-geranylgeranyl)-sn-glycerol synthase